jgi:hypothetical protein
MTRCSLARAALASLLLAAMTLPAAARKARAIFVQPTGESVEKAVLFSGTEYVEIELPRRNFSPEVELPAGDLVLAVLPGRLAADAPVPAGAQKITVPAAWSRCLLVVIPDPSNNVFPARVIPVNASADVFPKGETRIYNLSKAAIRGNFGGQNVKIMPGQAGTIKPPISAFGSYPVEIDCAFPGDATPTSICRSTWQHDPEARQILFVTHSPGHRIPRAWGILDHPQPESGADD